MTALDPAILAAVRRIVDARWGACAQAQALKSSGADTDDNGNLGAWWSGDGRPRGAEALDRALESLSRIIEDAGYDVERGERDGRPTWRVTGAATTLCPLCRGGGMCTRCAGSHGRVIVANLDAWDPARVRYDDGLAAAHAERDARGPNREAVKVESARRTWERAYGGKR